MVMPADAPERITPEQAVPYAIREYALTSANSRPENDPADWQLLGSNDDGRTWAALDVRQGVSFPARFLRMVFRLANPVPYRLHRLEILKIRNPAREENGFHLAELELIGETEDPAGTNALGRVVQTAQRTPPCVSGAKLFDGNLLTKWSGTIEGHPPQWFT